MNFLGKKNISQYISNFSGAFETNFLKKYTKHGNLTAEAATNFTTETFEHLIDFLTECHIPDIFLQKELCAKQSRKIL